VSLSAYAIGATGPRSDTSTPKLAPMSKAEVAAVFWLFKWVRGYGA